MSVMQESAELVPDEVAQRLSMLCQEMENAKASGESKAQRQPEVFQVQDGKMADYSPQCLVAKTAFEAKNMGLCLSIFMVMYSHPIRRCKNMNFHHDIKNKHSADGHEVRWRHAVWKEATCKSGASAVPQERNNCRKEQNILQRSAGLGGFCPLPSQHTPQQSS